MILEDRKMLIIRNAELNDLNQIIKIDNEVYGKVSKEVTATREMMGKRLEISSPWFFVAELGGNILGYLSLQPTVKGINDFKNWEDSTDNGTLENTYVPDGKYIYGVALTIGKDGHGMGLSDRLLLKAGEKIIKENKMYAYFSGRMPGYYKYKKKMSAEKYYNTQIEKKGKMVSMDPQIRMYESFGLKRVRLVPNGFVGDKESANYGVIFQGKNPFYNWPLLGFWGGLFGLLAKNRFVLKLILK